MDWMQLPITKRCTFSFIHCWSFSFNLNILFVYLMVWVFLISFNHFSLLNRIQNIHSTKRGTYCKVHNLANLEVGRGGGGTWNLSKNQFLFSIAIRDNDDWKIKATKTSAYKSIIVNRRLRISFYASKQSSWFLPALRKAQNLGPSLFKTFPITVISITAFITRHSVNTNIKRPCLIFVFLKKEVQWNVQSQI